MTRILATFPAFVHTYMFLCILIYIHVHTPLYICVFVYIYICKGNRDIPEVTFPFQPLSL